MLIRPWQELFYERLQVKIYESEGDLGRAAADLTSQITKAMLSSQETVRVMFSTGASQFSFVDGLKVQNIDWRRIAAFHLDEYEGIDETHPASFRLWLKNII
jgi:glucosamine-6-phosphate deaminase